MKIGVVGSRKILSTDDVRSALERSPWTPDSSIDNWGRYIEFVSGGADGVDTSAEQLSSRHDIDIEVIEPDYSDWSGNEHPAKRRNTKIVEQSDAVVAVWDGKSTGTRDTIDKVLDRAKPLYVHIVE